MTRDERILMMQQNESKFHQEVTFLQNMGQFKDPDRFVNTGFLNVVSYEEIDEEGDIMIKRQKIKCNEIMNLCFEHSTERWKTEEIDTRVAKVSGMIFRTYSELDLKEL